MSSIEEIIEDARQGRMFILVDHEDRENEGDLVIPAEMADDKAVNFMATHGRGLICLTMTGEQVARLGVPMMASNNSSRHETPFTVSIEAVEGVTTGISAQDRAITVAAAINPQVRVIGVQPEASPAAYLSLRDGRPYEEYDAAPTIADGLAGGFGRLPFEIAGDLIDEIVLVSEEETRAAVFALLELAQLVVEGAGAVGIAALLAGRVNLAGRKVVAVLSGANIDVSLLFKIMDERSET